MIEHIDALDRCGDPFVIEGVGGIGVGLGAIGGFGDPLVLYEDAVFAQVALAPFEPVEEG